MLEYQQLNLFDYIAKPKKTQREEDILYSVNHGSGSEHGKIRILNYYNGREPSLSDFSSYLSKEYGCGGCGCGFEYGCMYNSSGIEFRREGRKYKFNWLQYAKEIAKIIEDDEYDATNQMKTQYYKEPGYEFWTVKTYSHSTTYNQKKVISAYLTTSFTEPKGYVRLDNSNLLRYVQIHIGEIVRAVESGAYNTTDEIWEDIILSGRFINPATFGGRKWEDEQGIEKYLDNYKKTGFAQGRKSSWSEEKIRDWEFWCSRAFNKGLITRNFERIK